MYFSWVLLFDEFIVMLLKGSLLKLSAVLKGSLLKESLLKEFFG